MTSQYYTMTDCHTEPAATRLHDHNTRYTTLSICLSVYRLPIRHPASGPCTAHLPGSHRPSLYANTLPELTIRLKNNELFANCCPLWFLG